MSNPFVQISSNTLNPKPKELVSWNFKRMFILLNVSCVTCHMSLVTCHLSPVTCQKKMTIFIWKKKIKKYIYILSSKLFFFKWGGASRWRVCYQRGLPRLVYKCIHRHIVKKWQCGWVLQRDSTNAPVSSLVFQVSLWVNTYLRMRHDYHIEGALKVQSHDFFSFTINLHLVSIFMYTQ